MTISTTPVLEEQNGKSGKGGWRGVAISFDAAVTVFRGVNFGKGGQGDHKYSAGYRGGVIYCKFLRPLAEKTWLVWGAPDSGEEFSSAQEWILLLLLRQSLRMRDLAKLLNEHGTGTSGEQIQAQLEDLQSRGLIGSSGSGQREFYVITEEGRGKYEARLALRKKFEELAITEVLAADEEEVEVQAQV